MKILHVAETAHGGVGSYLEEIIPSQVVRYGAGNIRVVLPQEDARLFDGIGAASVYAFPAEGAGRIGRSIRMTARVVQQVLAWQPEIVHLHSTFAGLVRPVLMALPHPAKVVYCAHGWAFDRESGRVLQRAIEVAERALSPLADAVVSISRHDDRRAASIGIAADRCWLVANGIADLPRVQEPSVQEVAATDAMWPKDRLRVLFVGRLDRQKGVDILYDTMRKLGDRAHAIVVGEAVVGRCRNGSAPANVQLVGWLNRQRLVDLYASADVLVAPSRWEGFSLVAVEAMRSGLPVVASRVGGLQDVVADGISGRLVNCGDVDELVHVLSGLSKPKLREMGRLGRQRFLDRFQVRRLVDELDCLYRQLLADSAPQAGRTSARPS